jgi:purine nucleosidase
MRVILDHDGGVDDFITLLLLLSKRPALELLGVTVIGADSMPYVALNTTLKLLHTLGAGHVPVALSTLPGVNPFPDHWRWQGRRLEVLPTLNQHPHSNTPHQLPAQEFLLELLKQQEAPVTIVATGGGHCSGPNRAGRSAGRNLMAAGTPFRSMAGLL